MQEPSRFGCNQRSWFHSTARIGHTRRKEAINSGSVRPRRDRRPDLFQYRATVKNDGE
jgi:hypothetical protein